MAISIDHGLCESTGVCSLVCPEDVFEFNQNLTSLVNPSACTSCWICIENCVSGALSLD